MAHSLCMLDNSGCKHTLVICNIYRFTTAIMVARTRLKITLHVHCMCFVCHVCVLKEKFWEAKQTNYHLQRYTIPCINRLCLFRLCNRSRRTLVTCRMKLKYVDITQKKSSSYLTENRVHMYYTHQPVNCVIWTNGVCCENNQLYKNTMRKQNAEFPKLRQLVHIITTKL